MAKEGHLSRALPMSAEYYRSQPSQPTTPHPWSNFPPLDPFINIELLDRIFYGPEGTAERQYIRKHRPDLWKGMAPASSSALNYPRVPSTLPLLPKHAELTKEDIANFNLDAPVPAPLSSFYYGPRPGLQPEAPNFGAPTQLYPLAAPQSAPAPAVSFPADCPNPDVICTSLGGPSSTRAHSCPFPLNSNIVSVSMD